jgi:hypothetical protein
MGTHCAETSRQSCFRLLHHSGRENRKPRVNSTSVSARGRIAVFSHAPQIPFGARSARKSLYLDRRYIADPRLALDLRLIALSFAITALGKRRAQRLLIR